MESEHRRISWGLLIPMSAICLMVWGVGYAAAKVDTHDLARGAVTSNKLAKKAVTTKRIKKHAVNGSKVKDDSLTGKQIDESTLSTVPSADQANTATTAANGAVEFKFFGQANQSTDILTAQGAVFQAACNGAGELSFTATRIRGTADNGIAKVDGVDENDVAFNNSEDDLDAGSTVPLLSTDTAPGREVGAQADYMGAGGNPIVNANYASEESPALDVGADCVIWGEATTTGG